MTVPALADPADEAPRPGGFVIHVDLGPEAFAAQRADVIQAADTLRELIHEWLPGARTRTVLTPGLATPDPTGPAAGLRHRLAALPDIPVVHLDLPARRVTAGGSLLDLTNREFDLLAHLARAADRVVTRSELLATVWRDRGLAADSRTVDVHVRRLRAFPALADLITTVHRHGYRVPSGPHLRVDG